MIALSAFRTRDPKTFDNGSRQYQRVARGTFALFGWVAITALLLKWDLSRGFLAISFAVGTNSALPGTPGLADVDAPQTP